MGEKFVNIKGRHEPIAKYLIKEAKADVNITDNDQITALHYAAWKGLTNTVHLLCQSKAEINAKDKGGRTPLHYASLFCHVSTVKMLLQMGADANIKGTDGGTARQVAGYGVYNDPTKKQAIRSFWERV